MDIIRRNIIDNDCECEHDGGVVSRKRRDIRKTMVQVSVGICGEDILDFITENRIEVTEEEKGDKSEYEKEKIGRTWKDGNNGLMRRKKNIYNI